MTGWLVGLAKCAIEHYSSAALWKSQMDSMVTLAALARGWLTGAPAGLV
jgi:hypothetical protein